MNEHEKFQIEKIKRIKSYSEDMELSKAKEMFIDITINRKYSYNFSWMGRPIIQYPQDMIALQEIIWDVQPDLIIETGIAHGGSIVYYASLLELLGGNRCVLGIDIDIREHNKKAIEEHPMFKRIEMIQGSSIDENIVDQVKDFAKGYKKIMLILDSNHTHDHVLKEIEAYSELVSVNSYCVVLDTIVEDLPDNVYNDRPWGRGDNPKTAVHEFLKNNDSFIIDEDIHNKLLITVAPDGYLKKIK